MALKLPRLPVGWQSLPQLFERYWDQAMTQLEDTLNAITAIPIIQDALSKTQTAVVAAQQAATQAQQAAALASTQAQAATQAASSANTNTGAVALENNLVNSYVSGFSDPLITATAGGTVTIKDHQRVYPDTSLNPTVSVKGAVIDTGQVGGSILRFYYDDPNRVGGNVTYSYTLDPAAPPVQGNGRHSVGAVQIPMTGTANGKSIRSPGYVDLN